ncbi:LLM class flavin-dependent oxidoreductase [Candidatus Nitrosotenuis sp. DW1]|uniref:LLM class flavin-dependent oxidoreductase n=1 Tax=Candidatus Nitrosotenuis sp. DW1 TaxID=2259672 RepID=UPI0015CD505F|nr:LLM class flavin-dependent oxidoreductase [Candidatus Nitrosotenuis sp. DW1]QLH08916.1 LLM class flavin-dependent oxidoreductase [Candidatus Nitrosotenuis sp. DW1]
MKLSYSLGSLLSIEDLLNCAQKLSKKNVEALWVPETWGMENFAMLSAVSQKIDSARIGSSIINIYSRSPVLIAMGAATVDTISNKRLILGLGTSSVPIVQGLHGSKFEKPLRRMQEYVEIIRLALSGKKIDYSGEIFSLKGFTLLIKPPRHDIPIYLAAINQKMVDLTWKIADGVIFYLRPISEMKKTISKMQSKRKIDVACQFITCISNDEKKAKERARKTVAFYVSVGEIYRKFLAENGFKDETARIYDEYLKSGFSTNHELVTDAMLESLTVCGTPSQAREQIARIYDAGITHPIIQFNPIGNINESFDLMTSTLSDAN